MDMRLSAETPRTIRKGLHSSSALCYLLIDNELFNNPQKRKKDMIVPPLTTSPCAVLQYCA